MKKVVKEVYMFETGDVVFIKNLELSSSSARSIKEKRFKESGKKAMVLYSRETKEGVTYGALLDNAKFITIKNTDTLEYIGHIDMTMLLSKMTET